MKSTDHSLWPNAMYCSYHRGQRSSMCFTNNPEVPLPDASAILYKLGTSSGETFRRKWKDVFTSTQQVFTGIQVPSRHMHGRNVPACTLSRLSWHLWWEISAGYGWIHNGNIRPSTLCAGEETEIGFLWLHTTKSIESSLTLWKMFSGSERDGGSSLIDYMYNHWSIIKLTCQDRF